MQGEGLWGVYTPNKPSPCWLVMTGAGAAGAGDGRTCRSQYILIDIY
jgi:hypothetical protein